MTRKNGYVIFYLALFYFSIIPLIFSSIVYADDYSFDLEAFEKKPLEWGGYIELKWEHTDLNRDGAFYLLNFYQEPRRETLNRFATTLQLDGSFQKEKISVNWVIQATASQDEVEWDDTADIFEAFVSLKPTPLATFNIGKKSYKWGKGYAWNPVSVVDRPKDPNNPEEALEGFSGAEFDLIKSFSGSLQTVALTTVFIPVTQEFNDDFGDVGDNFAAKLYLLYKDTDIDLILFEGDSRSRKYGLDFSKNIATNFEIHGELIHTPEQKKIILLENSTVDTVEVTDTSYLLGLRYLTESDITTIVEIYHNDDGYTQDEMDRFFQFVDNADDASNTTANDTRLDKAQQLSKGGYGRPQAGQNYLFLKTTQKDPFNLLYTTPGLTAIINIEDKSYSMSPEITYTGFTNWECRLRLTVLQGGDNTEYGEKQNEYKSELKVRYFF